VSDNNRHVGASLSDRYPDECAALARLRGAVADESLPVTEADYEAVSRVVYLLPESEREYVRAILSQVVSRVELDPDPPVISSSPPEVVEGTRKTRTEIDAMLEAVNRKATDEWEDEGERREWRSVVRLVTRPFVTRPLAQHRPLARPRGRAPRHRRTRTRSHSPPGREPDEPEPHGDLTPIAGSVAAALADLCGPVWAADELLCAVEELPLADAAERVLSAPRAVRDAIWEQAR
jgi:hypothetical protein